MLSPSHLRSNSIMKKKFVLSGLHNLTANNSLHVDGVSVEDILSILNAIHKNPTFINWANAVDALYRHVVNFDNPHQLTTEQLHTKVIQVLYEAWLTEGYVGSLQTFINIIFQYVKYATLDEMIEGISETAVPPVAILKQYLDLHNADSVNAHSTIINPFIPGDPKIHSPIMNLSRFIGIPRELKNSVNPEDTHYTGIVVDMGRQGDEFSIFWSIDLKSGVFATLKWENGDVIRLSLEETTRELVVENGLSFVISIPQGHTTVKCGLIAYDGVLDLVYDDRVIALGYAPGISSTPSGRLTCDLLKMTDTSPLRQFVIYPEALLPEQVEHIFEHLD